MLIVQDGIEYIHILSWGKAMAAIHNSKVVEIFKPLFFALLVIAGVAIRPLMYVAFVACALYIVFTDDKSQVYLLFFTLMPVATVFKLAPGSTSLFTYLQLLFLVTLLIKHGLKVRRKFLCVYTIYVLYVCIGMGTSISEGIKQITIPLIVYFCFQTLQSHRVKDYVTGYSLGVLISSIAGYFRSSIPNMTSFVTAKTERIAGGTYSDRISRFSGLWGDPNYYSVNLLLVFSLVVCFHVKKKISTSNAVLAYTIIITFGALTGSKSFLLMLAVLLVWMVIELFKHKRWILGGVAVMVVLGGMIMAFSGRIASLENVLIRLNASNGSIEALTTGRTVLWKDYWDYFGEHPIKFLFGNGILQGFTFYAPHNTLIDFLDIYGIIGSILFVCVLIQAVGSRKRNRGFINWLPLITILMMYMFLSMIFYLDLCYHIMIVMIMLYDQEQKGKKKTLLQKGM